MLVRGIATGVLAAGVSLAQADGLAPQDYIEIEQLYARYNHAIDECDAEGWAATFTPDGEFQRFAGREALVGFVKQWCARMNGANRRHWNTNLHIVPTAEGASGKVLLMLLDVGVKPAAIISTGTYKDTLVKTADGWRFKKRTITSDAPPAQTKPAE